MLTSALAAIILLLLCSLLIQNYLVNSQPAPGSDPCKCCEDLRSQEEAEAEYLDQDEYFNPVKQEEDLNDLIKVIEKAEKEKDQEVTLSAIGDMTVTIYHAVPEQTDSTPMITASGLDLEGHNVKDLRVCALSRDLLSRWGGPIEYGDQIYIDLPDPELSGWWTVEDTMAKRWKNHIDLLVPTSRKGGKWTEVSAFCVQ